jgi:hypothetical protein
MHLDKSPGPDRFNPAFYQNFWGMCGVDIFSAVTNWLEKGYFPYSLNDTNIRLISKCENLVQWRIRDLSHYVRNMMCKMVSKLLANRLKGCLSKCVLEEQSMFVEGRIYSWQCSYSNRDHSCSETRGNMGELTLKIDISKAYESMIE